MSGSPATVAGALNRATAELAAHGADSPRLAARVLLERAAGLDRARQLAAPDAPLAPEARARFASLVRRRAAREPLAYIAGAREFWSLELAVGPAVLIPRPDSETVVAAALARGGRGVRRVLDLGTGSGCLLLALLTEWPAAFGVGTDRCAGALALAAANARALGLAGRCAFAAGDWGAALASAFDVLVCNPPYVATAALAGLAPEVAHEPRMGLDGGADGLACFRRVVGAAPRLLAPGGLAAFEIGAGQEAPVRALMRAAGLRGIAAHDDLSGTVRCLTARRDRARRAC